MTVEKLLQKLDSVREASNGWTARCPSHDDEHNSLSIRAGDDGRILLKCFAGCSNEEIVEAVHLKMRDLFPNSAHRHEKGKKRGRGGTSARSGIEDSNTSKKSPKGEQSRATDMPSEAPAPDSNTPRSGLTLAEYGRVKQLPLEFLQGIGLLDFHLQSVPAVRIPYFNTDGQEVAVRFRLASTKSENVDGRFRWKSGSKLSLYGLCRLKEMKAAGYITIVEGESDTHTLWLHNEPAIGLPGAASWKEEWEENLDDISTIYVVIEADRGGMAVQKWLARSQIRDRVRLVMLEGAKDVSELYLADPTGFPEAWRQALDAAVPWDHLIKEERDREAEEAYSLAKQLLEDPYLLDRIGEMMTKLGYAGSLIPPKLVYVATTSRLLERPLNLALVAPSAAGKNHAVDIAVSLVPAEAAYIVNACSPRALIYADEGFQHRTVIVAEADSLPEDGPAASAVRSIVTDNMLAYDVVEKNRLTGGFEVRRIRKPGPTGLITTSTRSLGAQMGTRTLEVPVADDDQQTREVLRAQARNVLPEPSQPPDLAPFIALQRWLALAGKRRVAVPFARALAELVPVKAVRMRRDFRQLLTCIQATALLYQCQRDRTTDGSIQATIEDYALSRNLLNPIFDMITTEGLTPVVRETIEVIEPNEELTAGDLARRLGLSPSTVSYRIKRAIVGGWLVNLETRRGHPKRLKHGSPLPENSSALPTPEELKEAFEASVRADSRIGEGSDGATIEGPWTFEEVFEPSNQSGGGGVTPPPPSDGDTEEESPQAGVTEDIDMLVLGLGNDEPDRGDLDW